MSRRGLILLGVTVVLLMVATVPLVYWLVEFSRSMAVTH